MNVDCSFTTWKLGFWNISKYLARYGIQMDPSVTERRQQSGKKSDLCMWGLLSTIIRERERADPEIFFCWPINWSNQFSDFLRLDRLDRFGKIIKSIFPKFWKWEFQFFSDFQNFFGFLKFREKCFFLYMIQISPRLFICRFTFFF